MFLRTSAAAGNFAEAFEEMIKRSSGDSPAFARRLGRLDGLDLDGDDSALHPVNHIRKEAGPETGASVCKAEPRRGPPRTVLTRRRLNRKPEPPPGPKEPHARAGAGGTAAPAGFEPRAGCDHVRKGRFIHADSSPTRLCRAIVADRLGGVRAHGEEDGGSPFARQWRADETLVGRAASAAEGSQEKSRQSRRAFLTLRLWGVRSPKRPRAINIWR